MWVIVSTIDGREYVITPQGITIGREGCTIPIPDGDRMASRRHTVVRLRGDHVEVEDLDSTNGTFLDTTRVLVPTPWRPGVTMRCGSTAFKLIERSAASAQAGADEPAAAPAPPPAPAAPPSPAPAAGAPPALDLSELLAEQAAPAPPRRAAPPPVFPTTSSTSAALEPPRRSVVSTLVIGLCMLVVGVLWWHHFQSTLDTLVNVPPGLEIPVDSRQTLRQIAQLQMFCLGAIVLASIGGLVVLGSLAHLATGTSREPAS